MAYTSKADHKLAQFLSNFPRLDPETIAVLVKKIPVVAPIKGTVLLKEGDIPKACYYVLEGLVRQYQFIDGTERTTAFYTEKNGSVSAAHYSDQTPSAFNLVCTEDCLLIAGNLEIDESHYAEFPILVEITKRMIETELNKTQQTLTHFILSPPKERYVQFLKTHPDLINRVPLHQIASYLGLTPESLSRIRKRLVTPSN